MSYAVLRLLLEETILPEGKMGDYLRKPLLHEKNLGNNSNIKSREHSFLEIAKLPVLRIMVLNEWVDINLYIFVYIFILFINL